ncbi:radial spoke head protein 3 homolog [Brachionichthys hirsutus]|uniref:radial spoke head protein 3 homolog n=1 Tax=Brachionichthys hirsutus TaxID=412623 RepID=UPI0036050BC3
MASDSRSKRDPGGCYTFSSRPRLVENRPRNREPPSEENPASYGNIMHDRRVVRGNTYAQRTVPVPAVRTSVPLARRGAETQRRYEANRKRVTAWLGPSTPEPVPGRRHIDVQTERYLEELSGVIELSDTQCQTDDFLDRPASPLFVPAQTGQDAATQVEEGDLFDFDREVQPLLEVLVGKTVEQSLLEVLEEEELAGLRAQQRAFRELRSIEEVEVQRLQEAERRRKEENERRVAQQREALEREREVAEKIAARAFSRQYLASLVPTTFTSLRSDGFFYDPVEDDVRTNFMPWLTEQVNERLVKKAAARRLLDDIIYEVAKKRLPMTETEGQSKD